MDENNIIYIEANNKKGFNYGYLLHIPKNLKETTLIAETNNTGSKELSSDEIYTKTYNQLKNSSSSILFEKMGFPYLLALFPRIKGVYTHALSRDTLITEIEELKRIDKQFIAMIEDAKRVLKTYNIEVEDKFILHGFSTSGAFSNRFAVMYPELLKMVISGGQTYAIIPMKELNDIKLTCPIGIYDLEDITGIKFNKKAYFDLPQLIYEGSNDDSNDTTKYEECMTKNHANILYSLFGNEPKSKRIKKQITLFKKMNYTNIVFKLFEGYGHTHQIYFMESFIKNNMHNYQ